MAVKTFTVTVVSTGGGNKYFIDGVQQATVALARGATYRFDQSDSSNGTGGSHPLRFSTNNNNSPSAPYTTGVTVNGSPGSPGAYTEIAVAVTAPTTLYYYCTNHSGMGGQMNLTSDSWGALSWGDNAWQSVISNIPITGQATTLNLGTLDAVFPSSGWGGESWSEGQWGSVGTGEQSVFGQAMTMGLGSVTGQASTGWGRSTWGSQAWNSYGDAVGTGQYLNLSLGNDGILIDTEINAGWGRLGWNINAWGVRGQSFASGQEMTMAQSSVTIDNEINTGWGSDGWGVEGWGASIMVVQPTGQVLTAFEGSAGLAFDGDSNVDAVGRAMTMSAPATVDAFAAFVAEPSGLPMTMSLTFDPEVIIPTGFSLTAALGDEASKPNTIAEVNAFSVGYWGYRSTWGFSAWGNGQTNTLVMSMLENFSGADPAPDAVVTGNVMAIALAAGDTFDITGDANIAPLAAMGWSDGTWGESTWGDGLYRPDTDDIFPLTMALGTAVLDAVTNPPITGLGVQQVRLGSVSVIGETNVFPNGNLLTINQGTGTNVLIWNAVDTGSAPTTPPGWKEVPTNAA